ncbi:MAG: methyltransferase domain-containing protein, partial [Acidobacteriota bacterium]|nr:methyltransferase domain-containing protein [Acidobacteriota bacterium]
MSKMVKQPPAAALVRAVENVSPGEALDLACGAGRHAIYLARRGWRVTAVDWSAEVLAPWREEASGLDIAMRQADLE